MTKTFSSGSRKRWRHTLIWIGVLALSSITCSAGPIINSVGSISVAESQTIVISGSGFGSLGPYTGDSQYISFSDVPRVWEAGFAGPCPFGPACGGVTYVDDAVTLIVDSWTDSKIVLGGFSGAWGANNWTLSAGDQVVIDVWNAQSGSGPASITTSVSSTASSTPEPAAIVLFGLGFVGLAVLKRLKVEGSSAI